MVSISCHDGVKAQLPKEPCCDDPGFKIVQWAYDLSQSIHNNIALDNLALLAQQ